jgi:hypothetical protein
MVEFTKNKAFSIPNTWSNDTLIIYPTLTRDPEKEQDSINNPTLFQRSQKKLNYHSKQQPHKVLNDQYIVLQLEQKPVPKV